MTGYCDDCGNTLCECETTLKQQVIAALAGNDKPEDIDCYWYECDRDKIAFYDGKYGPLHHGSVNDLPANEYDAGYGGVNGPPFIGFSADFVYVRGVYDGSEWIQAIPRHPSSMRFYVKIPEVGSG